MLTSTFHYNEGPKLKILDYFGMVHLVTFLNFTFRHNKTFSKNGDFYAKSNPNDLILNITLIVNLTTNSNS